MEGAGRGRGGLPPSRTFFTLAPIFARSESEKFFKRADLLVCSNEHPGVFVMVKLTSASLAVSLFVTEV